MGIFWLKVKVMVKVKSRVRMALMLTMRLTRPSPSPSVASGSHSQFFPPAHSLPPSIPHRAPLSSLTLFRPSLRSSGRTAGLLEAAQEKEEEEEEEEEWERLLRINTEAAPTGGRL